MVGMLQIITMLLCFYLVVKGVEILQIAICSPKETKGLGLAIGWVSLVACIVVAVWIFNTQMDQAMAVGS